MHHHKELNPSRHIDHQHISNSKHFFCDVDFNSCSNLPSTSTSKISLWYKYCNILTITALLSGVHRCSPPYSNSATAEMLVFSLTLPRQTLEGRPLFSRCQWCFNQQIFRQHPCLLHFAEKCSASFSGERKSLKLHHFTGNPAFSASEVTPESFKIHWTRTKHLLCTLSTFTVLLIAFLPQTLHFVFPSSTCSHTQIAFTQSPIFPQLIALQATRLHLPKFFSWRVEPRIRQSPVPLFIFQIHS